MSAARIFLDTNVLVYLFDEDSPAKQVRARQIFTEHARAGGIITSPQVLQELYVTVTRKLARPLSPEAAQAAVTHLATFPAVQVDGATILRAIHLTRTGEIAAGRATSCTSAARIFLDANVLPELPARGAGVSAGFGTR